MTRTLLFVGSVAGATLAVTIIRDNGDDEWVRERDLPLQW